jgi:hypothetical protein
MMSTPPDTGPGCRIRDKAGYAGPGTPDSSNPAAGTAPIAECRADTAACRIADCVGKTQGVAVLRPDMRGPLDPAHVSMTLTPVTAPARALLSDR